MRAAAAGLLLLALVGGLPGASASSHADTRTFYFHAGGAMDEVAPGGASAQSHPFSALVASAIRFELAAFSGEGDLTAPSAVAVYLRAQGTFQGHLRARLEADGTAVAEVTSAALNVGATATRVEVPFQEIAGTLQAGQRLGLVLDVTPPAPPGDVTVVLEMLFDAADAPGALTLTTARPAAPTVVPTPTPTVPVATPTPTPVVVDPEPPEVVPASTVEDPILAGGIASAGLAILAILALARRA